MPRVALLPWGDLIEDYLDAIGLTFEELRTEQTGGWLFGYVEALRTAGVESVLVCVSRSATEPRRTRHEPTGTTLWVLPPTAAFRHARARLGATRRASPLVSYLATPLRPLAAVLREERCDAVLCQEYEYPRFDACVLVGRLAGVPVHATFQGGTDPGGPLQRRVRAWALHRAGALLVGPLAERARVQARHGLPADRVVQVFNPVDLRQWEPVDRAAARAALGIPETASVVAWHGRVELRHKGVDVLAEAWRRVGEALPEVDLRLTLMGTGPDAAELGLLVDQLGLRGVQWIDEYVLDRDAIRRFLGAADVYAFPSRHEGFPLAPLEAMASGLPVVAAAAPGVRDIFGPDDGHGGVVVPTGDPGALADALLDLLDDPARRRRLGGRGRARIEDAFSLQAVGAAIAEALFPAGRSPAG